MSSEGRTNTLLGIQGVVKALASIRSVVVRAVADGHISKEEGIEIVVQSASAIITEGIQVGLAIASDKVNSNNPGV